MPQQRYFTDPLPQPLPAGMQVDNDNTQTVQMYNDDMPQPSSSKEEAYIVIDDDDDQAGSSTAMDESHGDGDSPVANGGFADREDTISISSGGHGEFSDDEGMDLASTDGDGPRWVEEPNPPRVPNPEPMSQELTLTRNTTLQAFIEECKHRDHWDIIAHLAGHLKRAAPQDGLGHQIQLLLRKLKRQQRKAAAPPPPRRIRSPTSRNARNLPLPLRAARPPRRSHVVHGPGSSHNDWVPADRIVTNGREKMAYFHTSGIEVIDDEFETIKVFADGSFVQSWNGGIGGVGVVFPNGERRHVARGVKVDGSLEAELAAIIEAFERIGDNANIDMFTDCAEAIKASCSVPAPNYLALEVQRILASRNGAVRWTWVKAHVGQRENEQADKLAAVARNLYRHELNTARDIGYGREPGSPPILNWGDPADKLEENTDKIDTDKPFLLHYREMRQRGRMPQATEPVAAPNIYHGVYRPGRMPAGPSDGQMWIYTDGGTKVRFGPDNAVLEEVPVGVDEQRDRDKWPTDPNAYIEVPDDSDAETGYESGEVSGGEEGGSPVRKRKRTA